jgi:REP element-mobilizing transposase RayT
LAKLRPDKAVSDVLRDLKANASGWMHDVFPALRYFSWRQGYGAFTVSVSQVEKVMEYIANQELHHAEHSFRDEFVALLIAKQIEFEEKYLDI